MKKLLTLASTSLVLSLFATVALAKIPAPVLTDEAKAKAAETAAKTAWSGKVANFMLCKSQDKAVANYRKTAANAKPAAVTPPCADPGPFVFTPPVAAVPGTAAIAAIPATPAVAAAAVKPAAPAAIPVPAVVTAPAKKS